MALQSERATHTSAKGLEESAKNLEKSTGSKCLAASADVRSKESMAAAVKACKDKFGRIDFVVCGACSDFLCAVKDGESGGLMARARWG